MKRLWVRLSITFGIVVMLLGFVIISLLISSVGLLRSRPLGPGPPTTVAEVISRLPRWTLIASTLSIPIGIAGGIIVSKSLTAPLSELAEAAQAVGKGELQHRLIGRGSQEIVEVAEAFNYMAKSLEEAQQQRRDLIADVAHELRTPLSVLQGNVRALLDDVYPLTKEEIVRLYSQIRHVNRLVEDLQLLTQVEANQLAMDYQVVEASHVLTLSTSLFEASATQKGIALQTDFPPDLPLVEVDPVRLQQVINNLLTNALRHTPQQGRIIVSASATDDTLRIAVQDTGDGISAENLSRIFERFARVDGSRLRAKGGSGLGLAIVRAIVEAHHGTVHAYSKGVGQGTTFIIRLPLRQPVIRN